MFRYSNTLACAIFFGFSLLACSVNAQDFSVIARPNGQTNVSERIAIESNFIRSHLPAWFPKDISITTTHSFTDKKTKSGYFPDQIWLKQVETDTKRAGRCWITSRTEIVGIYSTVTYGKVRHVTKLGRGGTVKLLAAYNATNKLLIGTGWNKIIESQDKSLLQWLAEQFKGAGVVLEHLKGATDTRAGLEQFDKAFAELEKFKREYQLLESRIDFSKGRIVTLDADYDQGTISGERKTIDTSTTTTEVPCTGAYWETAEEGRKNVSPAFDLPVQGAAQRALLTMMGQPAAVRDTAEVAELARAPLLDWEGAWITKRGAVTIHLPGVDAIVVLDPGGLMMRKAGSIKVNRVTEQTMQGTWEMPLARLEGTFTWTLKANRRAFDGQFSEAIGDAETSSWWGKKSQ